MCFNHVLDKAKQEDCGIKLMLLKIRCKMLPKRLIILIFAAILNN